MRSIAITCLALSAAFAALAQAPPDAALHGQLRQLFPAAVDLPRFPAQFRGKNIRAPFRVGADVHAVSRATMTVTSATRAIRNSARRAARHLLIPDP